MTFGILFLTMYIFIGIPGVGRPEKNGLQRRRRSKPNGINDLGGPPKKNKKHEKSKKNGLGKKCENKKAKKIGFVKSRKSGVLKKTKKSGFVKHPKMCKKPKAKKKQEK